MDQEQDYYRLLGISREAPEREIKRAYYDLARKLHPDKAKTPDEASRNANRLALISKAYNTLKDSKKRELYDAQRGHQPVSVADAEKGVKAKASSGGARSPVPAVQDNGGGGPRQIDQGSMRAQRRAMAEKAFVKGIQLWKRDEKDQALSFFEVAVKNDPDSKAQYHLKYAQCLMQTKGSFTKAVEHAEKACEMENMNVEFKLILADIYEQVGANSRARELYQNVLSWDEDHEVAKLRLSLLEASEAKKGFLGKLEKLVKNLKSTMSKTK